ncbi:MAG: DOMON-like domain-containing protein [Propionivibrio sp.]
MRGYNRVMTTAMPLLNLTCHPATPAPVVRSLEAKIGFNPDGSVGLFYCLRGDIIRLRIPEELVPQRLDHLWEHTCFEAFIGVRGETAYREFNFSPSGQWAAYAFEDYRQPAETLLETEPPIIIARRYAGRLEVDVTLGPQALPPNDARVPWQIGLSAVIEEADTVDGSHSYWALRHPNERPDFHHRDAFALDWPFA